jgi:hypothetical protein
MMSKIPESQSCWCICDEIIQKQSVAGPYLHPVQYVFLSCSYSWFFFTKIANRANSQLLCLGLDGDDRWSGGGIGWRPNAGPYFWQTDDTYS